MDHFGFRLEHSPPNIAWAVQTTVQYRKRKFQNLESPFGIITSKVTLRLSQILGAPVK